MRHTEEFYRFYRDKMLCLDAKPNVTHQKLAELEAAGKVKAVITQNIDGLHQMAGSRRVLELHGSVHRNYCQKCGKGFDAEYILKIKYKHDETIVKIVKIPISYQEYRWGSMTGRADELEQDEHFLEESEW